MSKVLSLRDANQEFSKIVRLAEAGEEFLITRRGKPVARLMPVSDRSGKRVLTPEQEEARRELHERMLKCYDLSGVQPFNRDDLYDR
ncbi:MAG: type II toxin-antitoxin system prevent-host-death family antitoxin [Rhodospirillales bacterium]|nr:MAG: type II toxin-antitoxin system prevent-host-death family antitoxin [Rhodospirillales bacterium]